MSVILPNYNHAAYLKERLTSILAQTFTDYELLLLDDASTDQSVEILKQYADRPNIRLLLNETNTGSPFAQWNRGVEAARGEYIWIAESDDTAEPRLLEALVKILDEHPQVGMAECDVPQIDSHGNRLQPFEWDRRPEYATRWSEDFLAEGQQEIKKFMYLQNTIPSASAVVFRRSVYLEAGPADPELTLCGDWWQWTRMLALSDLYFLAQPLAYSRVHLSTQRQSKWQNGLGTLESLVVQHRIQQMLGIDRQTIREGAQVYAKSWIQNVRAGRYNGPISRHFVCLSRVFQNDRIAGLQFLARLPYALVACVAKQTLWSLGEVRTK